MSAVDEIEAAIGKLEELRAASDDDTTPAAWMLGDDPNARGTDVVARYAPEAERGEVIAENVYGPDAELIVTLHRTIDAQLAILREVIVAHDVEHNWDTLIYTETALALARAINNTSA